MSENHLLQVHVSQLLVSNVGFVVLLKGHKDPRSLPIFIGAAEAQAIAIHINEVEVSRPLTHDLLKNVLDFLECRLMRVVITRLEEGTFFATLVLDRDGQPMEIDSRPSDAIALALRCGAPLYVAEAVMEDAGRLVEEVQAGAAGQADTGGQGGQEGGQGGHGAPPSGAHASPLDVLKAKLARAIAHEQYEEAARLRDEIKHIENRPSDN